MPRSPGAPRPNRNPRVGKITYRYPLSLLRWEVRDLDEPEPWLASQEMTCIEASAPWTEASTAFDKDFLPDELVAQLDYLRTRFAVHMRYGLDAPAHGVEVVTVEIPPDEEEALLPSLELGPARGRKGGMRTTVESVADTIADRKDDWVDAAWEDVERWQRGRRLYQ